MISIVCMEQFNTKTDERTLDDNPQELSSKPEYCSDKNDKGKGYIGRLVDTGQSPADFFN